MEKSEKVQIVEELAGRITNAQVALVADYTGLSVTQFTELRSLLRGVKAKGQVVKNTLARLSAKRSVGDNVSAEFEKFVATLKGPTLLITSDVDPVSPAKLLAQFMKEKQKVVVRGAWLDGQFLDTKGVEELSKMPGKEEVLAKLLALLNTPATQLLRLMNTPGTQVTRVIDAQREKLAG